MYMAFLECGKIDHFEKNGQVVEKPFTYLKKNSTKHRLFIINNHLV